jgi:hypothetical protein
LYNFFGEIKNIFISFFLLGIIVIFTGYSMHLNYAPIYVSASIMIFYFFITAYMNNKVKTISTEQLADSNYYLGFLFTLFSLSLSLSDIILDHETIDTLVKLFGISMLTTLLGLVFRVYLINFIATEDSNKESHDQIIQGNINMLGEVLSENIQRNMELSKILDERMHIFIESSQTSSKRFSHLIENDLTLSFNNLQNIIDNIANNLNNHNEEQLNLLTQKYVKIDEQLSNFKQLFTEQKEMIDNASDHMKTVNETYLNHIKDKYHNIEKKHQEYEILFDKQTKMMTDLQNQ